jgi:DNA-binding transcriptional LysR family regulator
LAPAHSGVSVMSTFQSKGITPNVVLKATDAEVIEAYVAPGLGIATLSGIAFDPRRDAALTTIKARYLFPPNISHVWVRGAGNFARPTAGGRVIFQAPDAMPLGLRRPFG